MTAIVTQEAAESTELARRLRELLRNQGFGRDAVIALASGLLEGVLEELREESGRVQHDGAGR